MKIAREMPEFPDRRPLEFAAERECNLPDLSPTLRDAWQRSRDALMQMKGIFASTPLPDAVQTIYVCGSMGRMEMLPNSDCDLVIVTDDSVAPDSDEAKQLHADIWTQLAPLGMARPKPDGIFSNTVTWGELINPATRGLVDEDQFVYGKRMQMLLDSQPVAQADRFTELQFEVLERFHRPLVSNSDIGDWTPLIGEVIRYWKALEVRTAWIEDPGQWRYLNVKLRHSRQLIIAGLLLSLCQTSDIYVRLHAGGSFDQSRHDLTTLIEIDFLQRIFLAMTPFQRIEKPVFQEVSQEAYHRLNECYELFLTRMTDDNFVNRLRDPSITELNTPEYREMSENAIQFSSVINEALRQQAEKCPPHVRQALMLP